MASCAAVGGMGSDRAAGGSTWVVVVAVAVGVGEVVVTGVWIPA